MIMFTLFGLFWRYWAAIDAEERKLGEQTGLDTLVVLAVNDGY